MLNIPEEGGTLGLDTSGDTLSDISLSGDDTDNEANLVVTSVTFELG